jgi:Big-like domain-containing protein/putative peptidoglycan binding protein
MSVRPAGRQTRFHPCLESSNALPRHGYYPHLAHRQLETIPHNCSVKRLVFGTVLATSLLLAPLVYAQSAAQELLQILRSPSPTPAASTTTASTTITSPGATVPVGVSLSTHIQLGTNLMPENSIIPEIPTATTPNAPAIATTSSSATLLQSLYAELQVLEAQIAALEASSTATSTSAGPVITSTNSCTPLTLTQNLSEGDTGASITSLQQFLVAQGYLHVSPTGYFGTLTQAAVQAFQQAQGIVSSGTPQTTGYGQVSPKTRAAIASSCTTASKAITTSSPTTASATSTATTTPGLITPITAGYGGGGGGGGGGGVAGGSSPTPSVSLTAPSSGTTVSGTSVTLTATASESGGSIASVQFDVGTTSIATISSSPYTTTWDSAAITDGTYTLYAVAEDTSGNYATSSESATVENTPVSISSISSGTPGETSATITWTTNRTASSTVLFGTTTAYGAASSSTFFVTSHSITLTGLTASTTYDFQVQSTNLVGSYATSSNQTFTTASLDTTPPTEPTNLVATPESSSQVDLSWTASTDNVGVAGYKIFRDGSQVATDTSGTTYNDTDLTPSTYHAYWIAAYDTAGNVSTTTGTTVGITLTGPDSYGTTWHELKIGAGGYSTGMDVASDGTIVMRVDVFGAYRWTGSQWVQLVTSQSMPAGDVTPGNNHGVYEIRIAPSNTSIFYMMWNGYVYKTSNQGAAWTKTNFTQATANENDNYRTYGQKMAIDPANPDVVYVGTESSGLWMTSNGGASWTNITAVPSGTSTEGLAGIAFDPSSGTTQVGGVTETNTIYVGSQGNGVYVSTNAGGSWSHLSGSPTTISEAQVASSSYYMTDGTNAWKYSGGTWTEMVTGGGWNGIAIDPFDTSRIVLVAAGPIDVSTDGGTTWSGSDSDDSLAATDIPWLANSLGVGGNFLAGSGGVEFDPTVQNKLWDSVGFGMVNATLSGTITSSTAFTWSSQSTGIEDLDTNDVLSPPGGSPVGIAWDRPTFYIASPDTYATSWGPNENNAVIRGASGDYASNDPSYVVVLADNAGGPEESSYSTNGGQTWTNFPSYPSTDPVSTYNGDGGSIAAASSTDIVWYPANGFQPSYSLDGGNTWNLVSLPGSPVWGGGYNYYMDMRWVTADRVNIGTFYMYDPGSGIYKSTNGGVTWTQVFSGTPGTNEGAVNDELESVPNEAGNLFFTGGPVSTSTNETFIQSTNGGSSWTAISNVKNVTTFGFGAPATYGGYPSIYIVGYVGGVYGIWRSTNDASTWTQIGTWPLNSIDYISSITGDINTYGRVYVGFTGTGFEYGDTSDAAPSVGFTTPSTNSGLSGSSVTLTATSTGGTVGISSLQFKVDGTNIGSALTSSPYTTTWNSTGVADGVHTLQVVSESTAGTYATSSISVTVDNTPPTAPTGLSANAIAFNEIDLSWNASTDNVGVAGYEILRGGVQVGTSTGTSYADLGVASSTAYTYTVKAFDAAGNVSSASNAATATTTSGSYDSATLAWVSAVDAAGGSVSGQQEGYVNTLISCYRSNGLFTNQDREWLLGAEDIQQAEIDIIHDDSWTSHGTVTFTPDVGITGNASNGYIDTGFVPSTAGGNYALNSANVDVYITNTTPGAVYAWADLGAVYPYVGITAADSGDASFILNDTTGTSTPNTDPQGLWQLSRTSSATLNAYKNGGSFISGASATSVGVPSQSIYLFAQNNGSGGSGFTDDTIAMAGIGGGLTSTQAEAKAACDNAYATSRGFSVFTSGPSISSISSGTPGVSTSTITWMTSDNASSKVVYGTTTSYDSASSSAPLVKSHSIGLTGLSAGTTYHFAVVSTDGSNNTSTSTDQTFTTVTEPVISNISSGTPGVSTSTITWTTDESANSEVVYGTTMSYGSASSSASLATSHSIGLTGLSAGTTYHFAVVSTDGSNNTSTSTDQTFTTSYTSSYDPATTAWVSAVTTASGTVSTTQEGRVNNLITGLKTDGIWPSLDRLWLYAGESSAQQAMIDIKSLATSTIHGTLTLSAAGYTGDGTSGYIDTGFDPATAGGNFSASAASIGVYDRSNFTSNGYGGGLMGQYDGSNDVGVYPWTGQPGVQYNLNDSSYNNYQGPGDTTTQGFWLVNLLSSVVYLDEDGSNLASTTEGSTGLINSNIYVFAGNINGTAQGFVPDQLAASFIGGGLSPTERTEMSSLLDAYMTSWGVNVY